MKTQADYVGLLEHSWRETSATHGDPEQTRAEFLSMHVFGFTTYDGDQDEILVCRAVDVCRAISGGATHGYINQSPEDYTWYLVMCNMPFFAQALSWGTSIRGAWWSAPFDSRGSRPIVLGTCGLYEGFEQLVDPTFNIEEWKLFIAAVIQFHEDGKAMGG